MDVLHVIPYLGTRMGGPVASLAQYTDALARSGWKTSVASVELPEDGERVDLHLDMPVTCCRAVSLGGYRWSPALWRRMKHHPADLVHSHGIWTHAGVLAGRLARRRGVPHVVAPCGMLQIGALRHSAWKKRISRALYQDRVLREAACLHAKSEDEYVGFRRLGLRNPVAIIPNPVDGPAKQADGDDVGLEATGILSREEKVLLFLGRLNRVKGLTRLLDAWHGLSKHHTDWSLVLAGPDDDGHETELRTLCGANHGADRVRFLGPVRGRAKWDLISSSNLLVLPSDFENFGTVAAEAMTVGVPVVTTTATPWRAIQDEQCGWWVEPTSEALAAALDEAMSLTDGERRVRGGRAKELCRLFTVESVAEKLLELYRWVSSGGEQPECVKVD